MSETWYIARYYNSPTSAQVVEVEVERWSEASVWVNGKAVRRTTDSEVYYPQRVNAVGLIRRTLAAKAEQQQRTADLYRAAADRQDY